ncbi:hypothetical protein [Streptomyces sp. NPDC021020]|uniref:hypothetical protein n=1 Tax=Streptomyces sp. NPDC021020 TaxID=3365109 RepID=UPI0037A7CF57
MNVPRTTLRTARPARAAAAAVALAALATACGGHPAARAAPQPSSSGPVGQVHVTGPDIDLTITHAVAHLDASGTGTLTMTVRNAGGAPEHLDMVATPDSGRGKLVGGPGDSNGSMTTAGILFTPGSTVTFDAPGPTVRLTRAHVGTGHVLPLKLEFGVAGLVELSATVA